MRLIDGRKVIAESTFFVKDEDGFDVAVVLVSDIEHAPTIDPEELRPKGEWEKVYTCSGEWVWGYRCDQCKKAVGGASNYCPNCGAKMG